MIALLALLASLAANGQSKHVQESDRPSTSLEESSLFVKPGKMVPVGKNSQLSLYCTGTGTPTVVLESGFGGGTAATWDKLQPVLSRITRTCSYDRSGYGFSTLGTNVPRDLRHAVRDLERLLTRSGEKAPYLLMGHSNGGLMIGAFADLHPNKVAGLIFLDAAIVLPQDRAQTSKTRKYTQAEQIQLNRHLASIRGCLARIENTGLLFHAVANDECVDPSWYASEPPDVAHAEIRNRSLPRFWKAYLSEAECNYKGLISGQAAGLLPHKWDRFPVCVIVADISTAPEQDAAKAFRLLPSDHAGILAARQNRARWEQRQAQVCSLAKNCVVLHVATTAHLVHNADLDLMAHTVAKLVRPS